MFNVIDDHSRFCRGQIVAISIAKAMVARFLDDSVLHFALPEEIILDNGPVGMSRAIWTGPNGPAFATLHRAG